MQQETIIKTPNLEKLIRKKREELANTNLFKQEKTLTNASESLGRSIEYLLIEREEELKRVNTQEEILTKTELEKEQQEMQKIALSIYHQIITTINEKSISVGDQRTAIERIIKKIAQTTEEQRKDDRTYIAHIVEIYTEQNNNKKELTKQLHLLREEHITTTQEKYIEPFITKQTPKKETLTEYIRKEIKEKGIISTKKIIKEHGSIAVGTAIRKLRKQEYIIQVTKGLYADKSYNETIKYVREEIKDNPDPLAYKKIPKQKSFQQLSKEEQNKIRRLINEIKPTIPGILYSILLQGERDMNEIGESVKEQGFCITYQSQNGAINNLRSRGVIGKKITDKENKKYFVIDKSFFLKEREKERTNLRALLF